MTVRQLGGNSRQPFLLNSADALENPDGGFLFVAPKGLDTFVADAEFNSPIRVIHGPKGCGKTTILLAKRLLLGEERSKNQRGR